MRVRAASSRKRCGWRRRGRAIDDRFDPAQALAGTVRYLSIARERFGRDDLAVVSYHMGIGNLESVLRDYAQGPAEEPIGSIVRADGLSFARIFFDSSPVDHAAAWRRLAALNDDSKTYYWRVLAAEQIMRLYREDPVQLEALAYLHERKASAEEVLHPLPLTERFLTPDDVERARQQGVLQALPDEPELTHFRLDSRLGELAPRLGRSPVLYRALRPEALALLCYLAGMVHAISGSATPLIVTSAVRDESYQRLLSQDEPRGDRCLLAAHDGLRIRSPPPLRIERPGASPPVRARPAPGAEPDRLGPRTVGDPRDRVLPSGRARPGHASAEPLEAVEPCDVLSSAWWSSGNRWPRVAASEAHPEARIERSSPVAR